MSEQVFIKIDAMLAFAEKATGLPIREEFEKGGSDLAMELKITVDHGLLIDRIELLEVELVQLKAELAAFERTYNPR